MTSARADSNRFGIAGMLLGGLALLVAVMHFWLGPIEPPEPIEISVADTAVAIRDAVVARVRGEEAEGVVVERAWGPDRLVEASAMLAATIAIILGFIAFVRREDLRIGGSAAVLGSAAIAFQFLTIALGLLFFAILIGVVLSRIGFDL